MPQRLQLTIDDKGIAHVELSRPEKRNALDMTAFVELAEAAAQIGRDPRVRVVVLSGQGPAFCAGIDLSLFADPANLPVMLEQRDEHGANAAQRAAWVWHVVPVPVLAAVHGTAFGAGLQLMSGADIRYVAPDTRLSIMEMEYGIVPDMAGSQLWKTLVREDVVKELTYTARIFDGHEAQALGFATRVAADPLAAALETAELIATRSPDAIRAAKRLFNAQRSDDIASGLRREADEQLGLLFSPNQLEAVAARMQKRPPVFSDPV